MDGQRSPSSRRAGHPTKRTAVHPSCTPLSKVAEHDTDLGEHLTTTVQTGTYCAYEPDPRVPVAWET